MRFHQLGNLNAGVGLGSKSNAGDGSGFVPSGRLQFHSLPPSFPPEHVETVPTGQARRFTAVLGHSCFKSSGQEKSPPSALPAGELRGT